MNESNRESNKRVTRRDKKSFLKKNAKKQREMMQRERLEISSRKFEVSREHLIKEWAQ